jgi:hypothetical protein
VLRGVYVQADVPDSLELRVDAIALVLPPGSAFSHATAARLFRLPTPTVDDTIHVTTARTVSRRRIIGVTGHVADLDGETVVFRGRTLTSPARTFTDVAACWRLLDLVALGDAAVRRGLVEVAALTERADSSSAVGCQVARRAARLVVAGVDSPMETWVRLLLVLGGLPSPEVNRDVYDEYRGWVARPDLSYPFVRLAIEYQGDVHRTDRSQWQDDIQQTRLLRALGWEVLELTARDVFQRPARTLDLVHHYLAQRGHPGLPAHPVEAWREFWPSLASRRPTIE